MEIFLSFDIPIRIILMSCRLEHSRKGNGSFQIRQESDASIGHSKQASNGQFDESSNLIGRKNSI